MAMDLNRLIKDMSGAALVVVSGGGPSIASYVRTECTKIAHTILTIEAELEAKQIKEEEARILLDMQKSATRSVLLTAEGLGLLVVEEAINAALGAVRAVVNAAVGFALL